MAKYIVYISRFLFFSGDLLHLLLEYVVRVLYYYYVQDIVKRSFIIVLTVCGCQEDGLT